MFSSDLEVGHMEELKTDRAVVFVVGTEGQREALINAGHWALSASESTVDDLIISTRRRKNPPVAVLLLSSHAIDEWSEPLASNGIPFRVGHGSRWAQAEGDLDMAYASELEAAAQGDYNALLLDANKEELRRLGVHDAVDVVLGIGAGKFEIRRLSTGIGYLDNAIGGGFPTGSLVVLAAGSSVGKTALAGQIADNIARGARPVLFVSLEMGRHEIVARSLSRLLRLGPSHKQASAASVINHSSHATWAKSKIAALEDAAAEYASTIAPFMHIMESHEPPTVGDIRRSVMAINRQTGQSPFVVVDYLQLLASMNDRWDIRRSVDNNVMALRVLARDLDTSVLVLSSVSRTAYNEAASMAIFKESGGVEFSADLALAMQPRGFGVEMNQEARKGAAACKTLASSLMAKYRSRADRKVEVVVLKNRAGAVPAKPIPLAYDALCNVFSDDLTADYGAK